MGLLSSGVFARNRVPGIWNWSGHFPIVGSRTAALIRLFDLPSVASRRDGAQSGTVVTVVRDMNQQNWRIKNWRVGLFLALFALLYIGSVIWFIIVY